MEVNYRKFSIILLIAVASPIIIIYLINFIIDPYQIAHKHWFFTPKFSMNQRHQNAGLIKNYEFDSAIIGSSMTANFKVTEANKIPGFKKTMKLSTNATYAREMSALISYLISKKTIKSILWGLHINSYTGSLDRTLYSYYTFPDYLYDDNIFNDFEYYTNLDTLKLSYELVSGTGNWKSNLDEMYNWHSASTPWGMNSKDIRDGYSELDKWHHRKIQDTEMFSYSKQFTFAHFNTFTLPIIKNNPNINFYFFFPPYSILSYAIKSEKNEKYFNEIFEFRQYVATQLAKFANVKLYAFESADYIVRDTSLYKDPNHYHPQINSFILNSIAKNRFNVQSLNFELHDKKFKRRIKEWITNRYKASQPQAPSQAGEAHKKSLTNN